jgi:hypothetical protein
MPFTVNAGDAEGNPLHAPAPFAIDRAIRFNHGIAEATKRRLIQLFAEQQ